VRIYFENFRFTLLGEVARPGVYTVTNEKISITEAIGMAGDLTIYGDRKNILLIREENGQKQFVNIDITGREFFQSPYYYLHSNDVLYVEPVKARIAQSDNFYRVAPLVMSTITLGAVILLRFVNDN
jgi:polysaccharide export outer membrane protein